MAGDIPRAPGITVTQDPFTGAVTGERLGQKVTKDELMEAAGLSYDHWYIHDAKPNAWPTAMKLESRDDDGKLIKSEPVQVWNFSLRLDVKPLQDEILSTEIRDALLADIREEVKAGAKRATPEVIVSKDGVMLEIDVLDAHFQKLAWGPETGTHYDLGIAADEYRKAAYAILQTALAMGVPVEKCVLVVGQDLFHTATAYATRSGTEQDVDGRVQKAARVVRRLLTDLILDLLDHVLEVYVICVPGNHGPERDWWMGEVLDARFELEPRVNVDNRPIKQKSVRFGNALIGFAHGQAEKPKDLMHWLQRDCPQDWADTLYHEWHLGHLHHEWDVKDMNGTTLRYLPSISGTDAWHRNAGFFGALRGARGFVWTKDRGLSNVIHHNIQPTDEERSFTAPTRVG